jgi:hypothetical protein
VETNLAREGKTSSELNGASGTGNAYARGWLTKDPCCYPSGKGQQVMAQLVFDTGLAPLR